MSKTKERHRRRPPQVLFLWTNPHDIDVFVEDEKLVSIDDPKGICLAGWRLADKNNLQANEGRVVAANKEAYSSFCRRSTAEIVGDVMLEMTSCAKLFVVPHHGRIVDSLEAAEDPGNGPKSRPMVLERFEGFVDQIDGPIAYVTLASEHGDTLFGEYSANELAVHGIRERRRFRCETVEVDGKVVIRFEAIPDKPLSQQEAEAIDREIDELLADDNLDGDY